MTVAACLQDGAAIACNGEAVKLRRFRDVTVEKQYFIRRAIIDQNPTVKVARPEA